MEFSTLLVIYLIAVNAVTMITYGIDKFNAVHKRWRIRVSTLLGLAMIGGSVGALAGMYLFRHKTRKAAFTIGVPVMLILQLIVLGWIMNCGWFG